MKSALPRRAGELLVQMQDRALLTQLLLKCRDRDTVQLAKLHAANGTAES